MVDKKSIILLCLVAIIVVIPLALYSSMGEGKGYFGGSDDAAVKVVEETGYQPWFSSIWKPPSGEMENLLFTLQAAVGAIILGYVLGYYKGQAKERRKAEKAGETDKNR